MNRPLGVMVDAPLDKLRRCNLGCLEYGQCKAVMHGDPGGCTAGVLASVEDRARTLYAHSPRAYRGTRPLPWDEAPEVTRQEFMEKAREQLAAHGVEGKTNG